MYQNPLKVGNVEDVGHEAAEARGEGDGEVVGTGGDGAGLNVVGMSGGFEGEAEELAVEPKFS
jgi:hypothetical protein